MKLARVQCHNPSCGQSYETVLEDGYWHAECPHCHQQNRVAGKDTSENIDGLCKVCGDPLDQMHIFGRTGYVCRPKRS